MIVRQSLLKYNLIWFLGQLPSMKPSKQLKLTKPSEI